MSKIIVSLSAHSSEKELELKRQELADLKRAVKQKLAEIAKLQDAAAKPLSQYKEEAALNFAQAGITFQVLRPGSNLRPDSKKYETYKKLKAAIPNSYKTRLGKNGQYVTKEDTLFVKVPEKKSAILIARSKSAPGCKAVWVWLNQKLIAKYVYGLDDYALYKRLTAK